VDLERHSETVLRKKDANSWWAGKDTRGFTGNTSFEKKKREETLSVSEELSQGKSLS